MKASQVLGVDLSLTAPAWCNGDEPVVYRPESSGVERLFAIKYELLGFATTRHVSAVYLEGYSYGSQVSRAHSLGEVGGVVKLMCHVNLLSPAQIVPPAVLKKYATGKGNASKPDMLAAAIRAGYTGSNDDNAVDAWWLWRFGLHAEVLVDEAGTFAYQRAVVDDWLTKHDPA